ncbi:MAG: alkaline phosphatase D family protein [Burkholderiaceae bacterium]
MTFCTDAPCELSSLPDILAGPMLRRLERRRLVLWLATRQPMVFRLAPDGLPAIEFCGNDHQTVRVGEHCYLHLLQANFKADLPADTPIAYDLQWRHNGPTWHSITEQLDDLCQAGQSKPRFVYRSRLDNILHGSCRKPHSPAEDGLVAADQWLQAADNPPEHWPGCLMMTGDQVYVDDVAGPMLTAIHELIDALGLYPETLEGAVVGSSEELFNSNYNYYHRNDLLPDTRMNQTLRSRFFEGARKPIFTTSNADNHLVTLAEVLAMYLLVWSPEPWRCLPEGEPQGLSPEEQARYRKERARLTDFIQGLPKVRRLFAHLPTLMIFDDHDITDDWNLTADWEKTAYHHPFSRRIIGNALIGYFLCQAWGNHPDAFTGKTLSLLAAWSAHPHSAQQDALIDHLLHLHKWDYCLPTEPKLVVLDTRTRRWRSERNLNSPSGLMDWEALSEFQTELLNHDAVVIVSAAPVFGVKLIETIQKLFIWGGRPLLVDAENWMAHKGTANAILNIFRHTRTPAHFVILSGDVHYSFVYGIRLRSQRGDPHLWQITSSGIKNEFPAQLLNVLDRLNRWLYSPRSPLNWFTRRRRLEISPYRPCSASRGERLLNQAGIGHVCFAPDGKPTLVEQITRDRSIAFELENAESPQTAVEHSEQLS